MDDADGQNIERNRWLEMRRTGIGGSDAAAILGLSSYRTALDVFAEKLGIVPASETTEAQQWGLLLEPLILEEYGRRTGKKVERWPPHTIWRSSEEPWLICTPDGLVRDDPRGLGVVQIKTGSLLAEKEWAAGEAPLEHQIQVAHEMAVTGATWGVIPVFLLGYAPRLEWIEMQRNEAFIEKLLAHERYFWERVQRQDPPPPEDPEDKARWIKRFFTRVDRPTVDLPMDLAAKDAQLQEVKERQKQLEVQRTDLENTIKEAIGSAEVGILPTGVRYTWKPRTDGVRVFRRSE